MDTPRVGQSPASGMLAHALESFDATTRLVLALLFVEHLTVEETAQALDLEVSQVDRTRALARDRLAARMNARMQEHPEGRAA
jgi:DNA-directed RNA polymerase specialized sigma24 family protein